jgi:hypothetical protein
MGRYEDSSLAFRRGHLLVNRFEPKLAALRALAAGTAAFGGHPMAMATALISAGKPVDGETLSSAGWVKESLRQEQQEHKLSAVLRGLERPADAGERIELARMCATKQLYRAAFRFYTEAFGERPGQANDQTTRHRYNAACAAALAGCGRGKDALLFECSERAGWRRQALRWLQRDLGAWSRRLDTGQRPDGAAVVRTLRHWQRDGDLAGVRGPAAIAKLPADEREAWTKLWAEVEALRTKAQEKLK